MAVTATQLGDLADLTRWHFPEVGHVIKDSCTLPLALLLQRAGLQTCPRALLQILLMLDAGDSGVRW